jgi:PIN like domain
LNPVFFTDRDLGKRFPQILADAGLRVERHVDHFPPDCRDEVWLETIGRRGWIAVTHDGRIRYKPNERAAVIRHFVALMVVIGDAPYPQLAVHFVATLPKITEFIAKIYRPAPSELASNPRAQGSVSLWYPR